MSLTEEQIDELRNLQKELRVQAQVTEDVWDNWLADYEAVSIELQKYNALLNDARDVMSQANVSDTGELSDYEIGIYLDEPGHFNEADAIDAIIEEESEA